MQERAYIEVLKEDDRTQVVDLDAIFDERRFTANLGVVFERLDTLEV